MNVVYGEAPAPEEKVKIEDHLWTLVSLNGAGLIENTLITLDFEGDQAVGSGGCNRYFTGYEHTESRISFGPVGSTQMYCEFPEGTMDQESAYFAALESAASYVVEDQQLKISNASGEIILVYDAAVVGNVVANEGSLIPEGAVVTVRLDDVSLADAPATTIGEQIIQGATEFPIPFVVKYNPEEIIENHTYAMTVRIEDGVGSLYYINTTAHNVITQGNPSELDVLVEAVQ